ncbi:MAG TPA: N-acetylmuramoyl-L-alanine amidase [Candidatus Paceibacterota bacterium]|nr:N-acetylmuramoyl-L-alanine amidase [Candidatus Paceibacterota bacterium]
MKKTLLISSLIILISIFGPVFTVYAQTPIKILLVPGHDNEVWGAQYGSTKEADMNLALATRIFNILKKDKRFEVHITRDNGGYTKEFSDYFADHQADIVAFEKDAKEKTQNDITSGAFIQKQNVPHHTVSSDVALKLYGFNKWADENKIDAMIHIHFNDYPRSNKWKIGKYTGFTIYMPDGQLANWRESGQLAASIFTQLNKKYPTSTYPPELGGLIPDQSLIALGANGTLLSTVRSVLVEYGYIYEKKFRTSAARLAAYKDMAQRTATGIQNYFFPKAK